MVIQVKTFNVQQKNYGFSCYFQLIALQVDNVKFNTIYLVLTPQLIEYNQIFIISLSLVMHNYIMIHVWMNPPP
jgi:hypothetical protein